MVKNVHKNRFGIRDNKNKTDLIHTIELMLRNIKSGEHIYIYFSKKTFYMLIFTLAMSMISSSILIYLILLRSSILIGGIGIGTFISIVLLALCVITVISGLWLVFKGIDIVTDGT